MGEEEGDAPLNEPKTFVAVKFKARVSVRRTRENGKIV